MEQSGSIPIFNIPGTLFRNIPQNFIRNFLLIYWYLKAMFHEYSTNIYLAVGKFLASEILFSKEYLSQSVKVNMKYEKAYNEIARERYHNVMCFYLNRDMQLRETGFVIQPNLPWIVATPDDLKDDTLVHLRPKFFQPLDLGRPISNEPAPALQMITRQ